MIKYYIYGNEFKIHFPLKNYPLLLEFEVNFYYLIKDIIINFIYSLGYFFLFVLSIFWLFLMHRKFYQKPFDTMQQKISNLLADAVPTNNIDESQELTLVNNVHTDLIKSIDYMIDYCHILHSNAKQMLLKQPAIELKKHMLHLMLTERHYNLASIDNKINISSLYIEHLQKLINEKYITSFLLQFLNKVRDYCCEYYHEMNIKIIVNSPS